MVTHAVDVLLHGVFASLTGGWFYNLHNDLFINTVHMYLWITLGLLPLIIYLTLEDDRLFVYALYTSLVAVLFTVVKLVNLYLHKLFKESDEVNQKEEYEDDMEEAGTATKAPSSDSITMPQGSSNAIRGSLPNTDDLPDSIASNFFDRNRSSPSNSQSTSQLDEINEKTSTLHDVLQKEISQSQQEVFKRAVHIFRHRSRPPRLVRVVLKISRTAVGCRVTATLNNNPLIVHTSVEPEVTTYRQSVTWHSQDEWYPGEEDMLNEPARRCNSNFSYKAIYTAFLDSPEATYECYSALMGCRKAGSSVNTERGDSDSKSGEENVVIHKHPDSPQVMGFDKKKKSIEHTYATLEVESEKQDMAESNSEYEIPSLDHSRKEDPTYDVLSFSDPTDSKEDAEDLPVSSESESSAPKPQGETGGKKVRSVQNRFLYRGQKDFPDIIYIVEDDEYEAFCDAGLFDCFDNHIKVRNVHTGEEFDVPAYALKTCQFAAKKELELPEELSPTKRKVCRTDGQTKAHIDFMAAFLDENGPGPSTGPGDQDVPPVSPRAVLRAMKTIAVVPERGQLHPEYADRTSANILRETRSFDTGNDSPVNVRLRRQSQLNSQPNSQRRSVDRVPVELRQATRLRQTPELISGDISAVASSASGNNRHFATDHCDTTPGAIHKYFDENGKEQMYMFEVGTVESSPGTSVPGTVDTSPSCPQPTPEYWANNQAAVKYWSETTNILPQTDCDAMLQMELDRANLLNLINTSNKNKTTSTQTPLKQYNVKLLCKTFTIDFDRLHLERLLDEDKYIWMAVVKVCLAVACALMIIHLFFSDLFHGIEVVWLCAVLAGCQFSLIKSVQPDSSSPTQGFNHITPISRSLYFLICSGVLLGLHAAYSRDWACVQVYGLRLCSTKSLKIGYHAVKLIIMFFPVIFLFGLFPQINTFVLFTVEQIDIHMFGGNACHSVLGACVAMSRSLTAVGLIYGFCYAALLEKELHAGTAMWFPVMLALSLMSSYHLSRTSGDITTLWRLIKRTCFKIKIEYEEHDQLPLKKENTILNRFQCDLITCLIIGVLTFAVSASTAFVAAQPHLLTVMQILTILVGLLIHYIIPHLRKSMPFLWFLNPCLKTKEHDLYEVHNEAKAMWFEKVYLWVKFAERNVLYPLLFLAALYDCAPLIKEKFGVPVGALLISVASIKLFRQCYSYTNQQYKVLMFTVLFFKFDYSGHSETFPVDYFIMSIVFCKITDLILKMEFLLTYIAPWQIVWGSAVHAFAQPFSIPHSGFLFLQTILSSLLSAPLSPFQGSALFIMAYVRPLKFWERDYNTRRIDSSNARLATTLEHTFDTDQNNFNSIFYEHLCRSLQNSLCGDLMMGRWGNVRSGDCFIMASDYLNALVHIVECGNGLVTFQLRGLEFKGTFCQMREVEAITEDDGDEKSCFCCEPGHAPGMLSVNAAFNRRWLAWEVMNTKYVLEGYSIAKNSATGMLQMFELRKSLMTYYVQCILFYCIRHSKFLHWINIFIGTPQGQALSSETAVERENYGFSTHIDADFDIAKAGVSKKRFKDEYQKWIKYCIIKREELYPSKNPLHFNEALTLCFGISLLARRALTNASPNKLSNPNGMLCGIHALLKNDIRISSAKDDWVFQDMDILKEVISPAIRMSLKLYQDHLVDSDQFDDHSHLYDSINTALAETVVAHEGDPIWRNSILNNRDSLLTLRHVLDDTSDEYQVFTLNRRYLSFRIIQVNRECVRGLWAGQQQELIFLRNTNPERGSIQHAKQALRNMINSSCDDPIGYPIYVSPLITSYSDTHKQVAQITGMVKHYMPCFSHVRRFINRLLNCGLDNANSIDTDNPRNDNLRVFYHSHHSNRAVTLPCDNKPSSTRAPSGSFHSCLDFGSNDPVSQESDASPVHHRSSGQSDSSKKSDNLGVAASDPILSCAQGLSSRGRENRSTRQHRAFLSGRAESTSAADKSQEILPPPNLRNAPTCDNENLNKVPLSSRCLLSFDGRGKSKMSSSVSLPSNTSLQHSDLPKKTTSDNTLHVTEKKVSRELLTKATSDLNFNPIIEVNLKSPATSDDDSLEESTPLLTSSATISDKHHSSLSAPHLPADRHRRVDFASTDIEIPDSLSSDMSLDTTTCSTTHDHTKESTVSLCVSLCDDILHSNSLRDGYSVDVGVQADRADSPCLVRTGSAPTIRHQYPHSDSRAQETVRD